MKTHKVRLYLRIRRANGKDAFVDPAWNRNRTLRAGYALVAGNPEHHPEGVYYLRFLRNGKRVWQAVGSDPDAAIVALQNTEHDLRAIVLGRTALIESTATSVTDPTTPLPAITLDAATKAYLKEVRRSRSPKTIAACKHMLGLFCSQFPAKLVKDITRQDLLDHMSALRDSGVGDRTVHNHVSRSSTLLKAYGYRTCSTWRISPNMTKKM